jgi:hypothetical protein
LLDERGQGVLAGEQDLVGSLARHLGEQDGQAPDGHPGHRGQQYLAVFDDGLQLEGQAADGGAEDRRGQADPDRPGELAAGRGGSGGDMRHGE